MGKLYEFIWERIGGRPWTYIIRDSYHRCPLCWLLGPGATALGMGIVLGHIFW